MIAAAAAPASLGQLIHPFPTAWKQISSRNKAYAKELLPIGHEGAEISAAAAPGGSPPKKWNRTKLRMNHHDPLANIHTFWS